MRLGLLLVLVVALAGVLASSSPAATYVQACQTAPGDSDPGTITDAAIEVREQRQELAQMCAALAERIEAQVAATEAVDARLASMDDTGPGTSAQRVALSPSDRNRLDYMWWGAWAIVGLMMVSLIATKWYSVWRFQH